MSEQLTRGQVERGLSKVRQHLFLKHELSEFAEQCAHECLRLAAMAAAGEELVKQAKDIRVRLRLRSMMGIASFEQAIANYERASKES